MQSHACFSKIKKAKTKIKRTENNSNIIKKIETHPQKERLLKKINKTSIKVDKNLSNNRVSYFSSKRKVYEFFREKCMRSGKASVDDNIYSYKGHEGPLFLDFYLIYFYLITYLYEYCII